jgi:hypothetical protein
LEDLAKNNIQLVRVVACNLYPFSQTVAKPDIGIPEAVKNIGIGKFNKITQRRTLKICILRWSYAIESCSQKSRPRHCCLRLE